MIDDASYLIFHDDKALSKGLSSYSCNSSISNEIILKLGESSLMRKLDCDYFLHNFELLFCAQFQEAVATYLKKFQEAVLEVTNLEDSVSLNALINGMRTPKMKFQLIENQVKTYAEAM